MGAVVGTLLGVVVVVAFLFMMTAGIAIVRGYVLVYLWQWFVQPLWHDAPSLTVGYAIGLALICGFLIGRQDVPSRKPKTKVVATRLGPMVQEEKSTPGDVGEVIAQAFGGPLIVLLVGWIVKQFMGG